ncbi:MAG: sulfite exporter TauE/SafE family protein [Deltaproteobacteria bacterium]|nr:sulfite exporter TauE/SafE family protein [Deltaproteobacteria bacterium]
MDIISFIVLGVLAGAVSGLVGIGGGIVVVPALVLLFGFTQHQAQGTTLAMMVPPIGLLAAWTYYKAGNADLKVAGLLCIGFFIGGLIGAKTANAIPTGVLKKVFGGALLIVSLRMIFWK